MGLKEYRAEFLDNVYLDASSNQDGITSSFMRYTTDLLYDEELIGGFFPAFYKGYGKNRRSLRVDGYYHDIVDDSLSLFVAEFSGDTEMDSLNKSDLELLFKRVTNFFEEVVFEGLSSRVAEAHEYYDLMILIEEQLESIRKIRVYLLTDKQMSSRVKQIKDEEILEKTFEFAIWDINKLHQLSEVGKEAEELIVDFNEYSEDGLPCLKASEIENIKSFLCVIDGNILADLYDKYGSRLLEGNVRSFLSMRVKVNKKIRETLLKNPEMFFSYNNGISATASKVEFYDDGTNRIKEIHDLQIVNGGQTTATISTARYRDKADLSNVYVQMKLTVIESDNANEIIPIISRSSNSQNKVNEADFFSTHSYHIRIEQHSRRVIAPATNGLQHGTHWFYERARGQYIQMQLKLTKAQKDKFALKYPKKQMITKTDLAKFINSWGQKPFLVSKGAQANFMKFAEDIVKLWEKDNEQYHQDYYKNCVSKAILFKTTEYIVSHQSWYQNSYRANIVTYSIASLSFIISNKYSGKFLNFSKIWAEQDISDGLKDELAEIAKLVYDYITDNDRPVINVTQWCKQELCWTKLKEELKSFDISNKLERELISRTALKSKKVEAKKLQKIDNEFELIEYVVAKGQGYWMDLIEWGSERNLITREDMKYLRTLTTMSSGKLPEAFQCKMICNVESRLSENGFVTK